MNEKNEMKDLIMEHIDEEECIDVCKTNLYRCETCCYLKKCYAKAKNKNGAIKNNDDLDYDFAEAINYGGYKTADDFWNELLE